MDAPIDIKTAARLEKDGANARALGLSEFDNPAYWAENLPRYTGEPTEVWAAKEAAWRRGWALEDAMRSAPTLLKGEIERAVRTLAGR